MTPAKPHHRLQKERSLRALSPSEVGALRAQSSLLLLEGLSDRLGLGRAQSGFISAILILSTCSKWKALRDFIVLFSVGVVMSAGRQV